MYLSVTALLSAEWEGGGGELFLQGAPFRTDVLAW